MNRFEKCSLVHILFKVVFSWLSATLSAAIRMVCTAHAWPRKAMSKHGAITHRTSVEVSGYSGKRHLRTHALAPWKQSEPEGKLPPGSILPHSQDIGESGRGRKIFTMKPEADGFPPPSRSCWPILVGVSKNSLNNMASGDLDVRMQRTKKTIWNPLDLLPSAMFSSLQKSCQNTCLNCWIQSIFIHFPHFLCAVCCVFCLAGYETWPWDPDKRLFGICQVCPSERLPAASQAVASQFGL